MQHLMMVILGVLGSFLFAFAETQLASDTSGVFELGKIVVKRNQNKSEKLTSQIDAKKMEEQGAVNVAQAVNLLPGVAVSNIGARYETGVNIRGFDLRQIPLYIDGIPQYVPYDGYVDLARFTTYDLSEIRVEKGYSSVLYGPNAMGGAINLVKRKPLHSFQFDALLGVKGYKDAVSDTTKLPRINGNQLSLNIGSKLTKKVYITAAASGLYLDSYRLSKDFSGTTNQAAGVRDQSYHRDAKVSAKVGFTPAEGSEYALSYNFQHGEKGGPIYAGSNAKTTPRYWRWPYWDKQSVYFTSRSQIGSFGYVKVPLYYDQFKNSLYSYDDAMYKTFKKGYAFKSWYDDYTVGAGIEAGTSKLEFNDLRIASHYKRDLHSELNSNDTSKNPLTYIFVDETKRFYIDHTFDIGMEDGVKLFANKLSVNGGVSFDHRESERADNYFKYHTVTNPTTKKSIFVPDSIAPFAKSTASAWNLQGKAMYDLFDNQNVSFSISRKTRFPTIKDRYSYKLGTAYPNADLEPEVAVHVDLGYGTKFEYKHSAIEIQCNLFYSHIDNAIQSITVDAISPDIGTKTQMQNVGKAEIAGRSDFFGNKPLPGVEFGVNYIILKDLFLAKNLGLTANYSYAEKRNMVDPSIKFTDMPTQKYLTSLTWSPIERSYLMGSFEWNSERYVDSKGEQTLAGYRLLNLKGSIGLSKNVTFEAGVNNAMDVNYSIQEGYPEEGRNYFANMRIGFFAK